MEIADWNMELYVATDPTAPIRSTVGDFVAGEWPRTLSLPTILDPDWSEDGFILRVIYGGEYAIGDLQHVEDSLEGTAFDKPLWHTFLTTEYFGIPIPYPGGMLFINCTFTLTTDMRFDLNATVNDLVITLWVDGVATAFNNWGDGAYTVWYGATAVGQTVTITVESGALVGLVLYLGSSET